MNADEFRLILAATMTWCHPRFAIEHPKESLRSDTLHPSIVITASDEITLVHRTVASVVERRASILGSTGFDAIKMEGRILGFYVRQTISDGVSETETDGFIDDTNTPPWDSWICMADELLVSWVPAAMVDKVHVAIECNAEGCIAWLTDIENDSFVSLLRQHHLVW